MKSSKHRGHDVVCTICGSIATLNYQDHPGYNEPDTYDIYYCSRCDSSFAMPLEVNDKVYDIIYSLSDKVPGYDRYYKYAANVLLEDNPLDYLANSEDVYWGIKKYFSGTKNNNNSNILEIGSGLGYLTYSLRKAGLNATGLELSPKAVKSAIERYGDFYVSGDLFEFSKTHAGLFDVVILTEVIEHIPDVISFLSAISNLLVKGGEIVVTTPNKSSYPHNILWHTEAPPIHLWWLSELSMKTLAGKIGHSIRIADFTEYNRLHHQSIALNLKKNTPYYCNTLTRSGQLISVAQNKILQNIKMSLKKVKVDKILNAARSIKINYVNQNMKRRHTMCAIFTKN